MNIGANTVEFQTDAGNFTVEVRRDWAPLGADHFQALVGSGFYDECKVFRVVATAGAQPPGRQGRADAGAVGGA